jgi:hypothetical protein
VISSPVATSPPQFPQSHRAEAATAFERFLVAPWHITSGQTGRRARCALAVAMSKQFQFTTIVLLLRVSDMRCSSGFRQGGQPGMAPACTCAREMNTCHTTRSGLRRNARQLWLGTYAIGSQPWRCTRYRWRAITNWTSGALPLIRSCLPVHKSGMLMAIHPVLAFLRLGVWRLPVSQTQSG